MSQQQTDRRPEAVRQAPPRRRDLVDQLVGIVVLALFAAVFLVGARDEHGFERIGLAVASVPLTVAAMTQAFDLVGKLRRKG